MKVDLIESWGSDLSVVNAARVSFDKESEWEKEVVDVVGGFETVKKLSDKDKKLINFLAREQHTSCFEHMGATLRLKVPIFIARQIQRHRTFSYNEVSRRYIDDEPEFFWPDTWRMRADNVKQGSSDVEVSFDAKGWAKAVAEVALETYERLLEEGVAPEQARMILPQNMYTSFYMSGNLRAWSHFLSLRLDEHAQKEVRDVAEQVRDILAPLWPVSMEALLENATG